MLHGIALTLLALGAADAAEPEVFTIPTRAFAMPLAVEPSRVKEIREILLEMSDDQGRTWKVVGRVRPDARQVVHQVPADGLYYFRVQVVQRDGSKEPSPEGRVRVEEAPGTVPPPIPTPADEVAQLKERIRELERRVEILEKRRR